MIKPEGGIGAEEEYAWLPAELRCGAVLFAAGEWWEAHEAWEAAWAAAQQGPRRQAVQVLILLAAALHKRWRHGSQGRRNYVKAQTKMGQVPPGELSVDWPRLLRDVDVALGGDRETWPRLWPARSRTAPVDCGSEVL